MLNYDWRRDRYVEGPAFTLAEKLYDQIALATRQLGDVYDDTLSGCDPNYDAINRLDAYLTGLEKLLAWEG